MSDIAMQSTLQRCFVCMGVHTTLLTIRICF